jgi:hypothetical protein
MRNAERSGGGRLFVSLERGEVAACVRSFAHAGVAVRDAFWGMPVKVVADPAGNDLLLYDDDLVVPPTLDTDGSPTDR